MMQIRQNIIPESYIVPVYVFPPDAVKHIIEQLGVGNRRYDCTLLPIIFSSAKYTFCGNGKPFTLQIKFTEDSLFSIVHRVIHSSAPGMEKMTVNWP